MAKRGRKPKEENKKEYFGEREEQAVLDYNNTNDAVEKNRIYNSILKPAFIKMIESIIRRYKLYGPEEEFEETFNDTLSFMLTKMGNFKPVINGYWEVNNVSPDDPSIIEVGDEYFSYKKDNADEFDPPYIKYTSYSSADRCYVTKVYKRDIRKFKAYSYCGTIAKNYLIQKVKQFQKKLSRNTPYEEVSEVVNNDIRLSEESDTFADTAKDLIREMSKGIESALSSSTMVMSENEERVGEALMMLLNNWEEILDDTSSNKLNKSSVLYFLREETRLGTKEIRDSMKRFKTLYKNTKQDILTL